LAREQRSGVWELTSKAEPTLRALGERADILRTMQRALRGEQRELALFDADPKAAPIVGRIVSAGYFDALDERAYVIVDGIDRQARTAGATWLDRWLVNGDTAIANAGFGATAKEALRKRVDFLIEHGFAQREGERLLVRPNLLTALRQRDLDGVAKALSVETG